MFNFLNTAKEQKPGCPTINWVLSSNIHLCPSVTNTVAVVYFNTLKKTFYFDFDPPSFLHA